MNSAIATADTTPELNELWYAIQDVDEHASKLRRVINLFCTLTAGIEVDQLPCRESPGGIIPNYTAKLRDVICDYSNLIDTGERIAEQLGLVAADCPKPAK